MITGINHLTFAVLDLEKSFIFYRDVLGCRPLAKWKRGAYLLAGDAWLCLSLDTKTEERSDYTHTAFATSDFEALSARLKASGARIWKDNTSEGDSLYFLDPDGHRLEIHATSWKERIASTKLAPYEGMEFFV